MTKLFLTVAAAAFIFAAPSFADNHGEMEGHSDVAVSTEVVVDEAEVCTQTNDAGEEVTVECAVEEEIMHDESDHGDKHDHDHGDDSVED
jgi:hypothetical protein